MKKLYYNSLHNIAGPRIKELRQKRGYSQSQLAARVQTQGIALTQDAISRVESRQRILTDYELLALAQALNVAVGKLLSSNEEESTLQ